MFSRLVGREFRVPGSLGVSSRNRYRGQTLGGRVLWDIYVTGSDSLGRTLKPSHRRALLSESKQASQRQICQSTVLLSLTIPKYLKRSTVQRKEAYPSQTFRN